jgi:hypothetical protein
VRVNQALPFLSFSSADWEMLVDIRNMFREEDGYASLYDEALALRSSETHRRRPSRQVLS